MLAWSEGTDNGRQKTEIMDVAVISRRRKLLLITPITLANITLSQNSNQRAGRYRFAPVGGMPAGKRA